MVKSKYETGVLPKLGLVEAWAREGLAERQIARNLCISMSTLGAYKQRHEDLREALERGKELVDLEVENDLLKKCRGYNAPVKRPTSSGRSSTTRRRASGCGSMSAWSRPTTRSTLRRT